MKRALLAAVALAALFHLSDSVLKAQPSPTNPLGYFQSMFVTGDAMTFGTGLNPSGVGNIVVSGVPADRDILAAFLYWQAIARQDTPNDGSTGALFRGNPLSIPAGILSQNLSSGSPTCGSNGGGTGSANGSKRVFTYRMDALRYFPVDPATGKQQVNGSHSLRLPASNFVEPLGASLVIVYRDPDAPLRAVVMYEGAWATDQSTAGMTLNINGFYDATPGTNNAKLTLIGGNGQGNKHEITRFNGSLLSNNAFQSSLGAKWDNPTFTVSTPAPNQNQPVNKEFTSQVTTSVGQENLGTFDCVTLAAVVYSVPVNDPDGDGLLTAWERPASSLTSRPLLDPNGFTLPDLSAMGADPNVPDVFLELGYMYAEDDPNTPAVEPIYGGVSKPAHSHLPGHEALKIFGDALKGGGITDRVRLHIDAGPDYPLGDPNIPELNAEAYLVPRSLARGGEAVNESATVCTPEAEDPEWFCQFSRTPDSSYPGTVGWKTGYQALRDEVFSVTPPLPSPLPEGKTPEDYCGTLVPAASAAFPGQRYACSRRFDENRHDTFHYALLAHAIGLPKSNFACRVSAGLPGEGTPVDSDADGHCAAGTEPNPDFHAPRTNGAVGDYPGGDMLVTLGAFADASGHPVGTPFMQASTLMHEFGHHSELRHGGGPSEPNCKPTYLSVMNYLYALRGVLDNDGQPHLEYAGAPVGLTVNEASLNPSVGDSTYRLGWYAPLAESYLAGQKGPALRRCDGSERIPGETDMVRVDAITSGLHIDWDADGNLETNASSQDVNYSGVTGDTLTGWDDWSNLHIDQLGSRRNAATLFIDSSGVLRAGPSSLIKSELIKSELIKSELMAGDEAMGDSGISPEGRGDLGKGDDGGGDMFRNEPQPGEMDAITAGDLAKTPPNRFQACVVGVDNNCSSAGATLHDVAFSLRSPNVGGVSHYIVYRVQAAGLVPGQLWETVATINHVPGQREYAGFDASSLTNTAQYTYFAVAVYAPDAITGQGQITSDVSRQDTITAVNDPAVAGNDEYSTAEDTLLTVAAPGILLNDGDPDDPCSTLSIENLSALSQPSAGALTVDVATGALSFTPMPNFNTGSSGPVTFTYSVRCGTMLLGPATVSISVTAVNDAPVAAADSYATDEDTPLTVAAPGVLGNDTDVESQATALTATLVGAITPASAGTLALAPNGGVSFTPAANYNGSASFTYRAVDESLASNTATVTITIRAVDDPPTAANDSYSVTEDTALNVAAPGVLGNDGDGDGTPVTAALVSGPASGTLSLSTNGAFSYTPNANFAGSDAFTYTANSGGAASGPATVTIVVTSVNDLPTLSDIPNQTIDQDAASADIPFTVGDVETSAGNLIVSGVSGNTALVPNGGITFGGSGASRTVKITPVAGQSGSATITVTVTDTNSPTPGTTSKSFTVTVRAAATFFGVQNTPPSRAQNAGSSIPMVWQYNIGSTAVNSGMVAQRITVQGPNGSNLVGTFSCTNQTGSTPCTDSGSSFFRYDPLTNRWSFNLQTKDAYGVPWPTPNPNNNVYTVRIEALTPGYRGTTFDIRLSR